jgi:hypothetical protein
VVHGTTASSPSPPRRSPPPPPSLPPKSQKSPPSPPKAKSPAKKKASRGRKKASSEKLPYKKFEEESKAVAQKQYDDLKARCAEERAQKRKLEKNPTKLQYIQQQELRKKSRRERRRSVRQLSPKHYQTMNALSKSHRRIMRKRGELGKMLHSSSSKLSNLSTRYLLRMVNMFKGPQ